MTSNNVDVVEEPPMTMVREVITMPYKGREEELDKGAGVFVSLNGNLNTMRKEMRTNRGSREWSLC